MLPKVSVAFLNASISCHYQDGMLAESGNRARGSAWAIVRQRHYRELIGNGVPSWCIQAVRVRSS